MTFTNIYVNIIALTEQTLYKWSCESEIHCEIITIFLLIICIFIREIESHI